MNPFTNTTRVEDAEAVYVFGHIYSFLATRNSTGGAYALIHAEVPPGDGPATHIHHRECESFYVLDGEDVLKVITLAPEYGLQIVTPDAEGTRTITR